MNRRTLNRRPASTRPSKRQERIVRDSTLNKYLPFHILHYNPLLTLISLLLALPLLMPLTLLPSVLSLPLLFLLLILVVLSALPLLFPLNILVMFFEFL
uniref:Uncharacterized protein n=1 Tax=Arcella intermedia TaxID=1963864 RepID=A0A6B2LKF1_9EUKA